MRTLKHLATPLAIATVLASCTATQSLVQHPDDVYFMPSDRQAAAPKSVQPQQQEQQAAADDYYDSGTSQQLSSNRSYYDLAYNDPYYYNYGRFGFGSFGSGLAWQFGMGYSDYGNAYPWGYGTGAYSGWYGAGTGYWYHPRPWGQWNSPWGWNDPYSGFNSWGIGYGWGGPWNSGWPYGWSTYGNYWGPNWNCYGCATDGSRPSSTHVGHRPSMTRSTKSDPSGLSTAPRLLPVSSSMDSKRPNPVQKPGLERAPATVVKPVPTPRIQPPTERVRERRPTESPGRQPGFDRTPQQPMERTTPAPSRDGGGSAPMRRR